MIAGSRKLPTQHLTIRVPWHDDGWLGTVCKRPRENTSCLVLSKISLSRNDELEAGYAGKRFDELSKDQRPPCAAERASFMAPFELRRKMQHPYSKTSEKTHGHFAETELVQPAYSAACVPFRWMLKKKIVGDEKERTQGLRDALKLDYQTEREPDLPFETSWCQERDNQLILLDTFFGAVAPAESLCFFYAKRTPLAEDPRRVIVGVGRVKSVGSSTEYKYSTETLPLRCVLWERNVVHSIREGFDDGFLFPYQTILELAGTDPAVRPEDYVAFAPDEFFEEYSYGSELLPHDGAIASLIACAASLRKLKDIVAGPWDKVIAWVDRELNRLWKARGAFPGLGSALSAFGLEHGNLIAYEIANAQAQAKKEWTENPWDFVDTVFENPSVLPGGIAGTIGATFRQKWKKLKKERRALLMLLSRCAISADQAKRYWNETEREAHGIPVSDAELLQNLYRVFELDRRAIDAVAFAEVDRGLYPDPVVQRAFPVPAPSALEDAIDPRRVRALLIDTLEDAAVSGHTLLPRAWAIQRIRDRALAPPCPLDEDTLAVTEEFLGDLVLAVPVSSDKKGFQLDRFVETRDIIVKSIRRRIKPPRHAGAHDWVALVEQGIGTPLPKAGSKRVAEEKAREEKAAALAEIHGSRGSVLIGPAGTGKTTLLRILCAMPEVEAGGILLLAPTGKARVRLEQQTGRRGEGKTIAQFLSRLDRYDGGNQTYHPNAKAPKCSDFKTVIVDECSMLTEEQLAALLDGLSGVERLILVGDPRQLPPIGAGRPFVDIVAHLAPEGVEALFPKRGPGYAELTIIRRQDGLEGDDVLLAAHFGGRPLDPGSDEVWDRLAGEGDSGSLRLVEWSNATELQDKLVAELVRALALQGPDDERTFEMSLGGTPFGNDGRIFFWAAKNGSEGAAAKAESWQILSPVRGALHGVEAINRAIQARFRKTALGMATPKVPWYRKIPKPLGPQGLLWGDKVINVANNGRRNTWPKLANAYVANGDVGVIVGEYKTQKFPGLPKNLEVELASQPGFSFKYWANEFGGDDGNPQLELAYALTVHKTQGSEFGTTFVVLPNPCRLLSRELLYTALTRHRSQLVVLHQGPMREFRRFGSEGLSDIAGRMTNLFREPRPREVTVGNQKRFLEEWLIHRTERGELVRSKSEVVIADKLLGRRVDYVYEQSVTLEGGSVRSPDFTIVSDAGTYYWEHLGMLADPVYQERWKRKLGEYRRSGILPHEEGGGPKGTLLITRDDPRGGIDSAAIAKLIDEVILGD